MAFFSPLEFSHFTTIKPSEEVRSAYADYID